VTVETRLTTLLDESTAAGCHTVAKLLRQFRDREGMNEEIKLMAVQDARVDEIHLLVDLLICENKTKNLEAIVLLCQIMTLFAANVEQQRVLAKTGACELTVNVLRVHGSDPAVAKHAVLAIGQLALSEETIPTFITVNTGPLLWSKLREHRENADVLAAVCGTLRHLLQKGKDEEISKSFGDALDGCELLVELLSRQEHNNAIGPICLLIETMTLTEEGRMKFISTPILDVLLTLLRERDTDSELTLHVCRSLCNLVCVDEMNVRIGSMPGFSELLTRLLREHANEVDVVKYVSWTIGRMVKHRENSIAFSSCGTCELLMNLLRESGTHRPPVASIRYLCLATSNLSCGCAENTLCLIESGYVELLVDIWAIHEQDKTLKDILYYAVKNLSTTRVGIEKLSQHTILLKRLCSLFSQESELLEDADILCLACVTMGNLLTIERNRIQCIGESERECCERLFSILQRYRHNAEVVGAVLFLMGIAGWAFDAEFRVLFGKWRVCEILVSLLRDYLHDKAVFKFICQLIHPLAYNKENMLCLGQNVCDLLVDGLWIHKSDEETVLTIIGAMSSMAIERSHQRIFGHRGVCELLIEVLVTFPNYIKNCKMANMASLAIGRLAIDSENRVKFSRTSVCEIVLTILKEYPTDVKVVCHSAGAISSLANNAESKNKFLDDGAVDLLLLYSKEYQSDATVSKNISLALTTLTGSMKCVVC
jgi:hypothetical protein